MSGLVTTVVTIVGAYLAVVAVVFLGQSGMLYLPNVPTRELVADPGRVGLEYQDVELQAEDGVRLHGWYVPAEGSRGTLLFFHGNAGNISHRLDSIRIFHDLGLAVFILDYRGYGRSDGRPSERGTALDARAAWRHVTGTRSVDPQRVVLFGRSLGAAVAARLAVDERPAALILESAFTSVPDLAAELYWWLPVRWLARFEYATGQYVGRAGCPVLVVHSPDDEIIPYRHGEAIFAAAPEPKALLRLRGGHNDGFLASGADYRRGLDAFLARHLR